MEKMLIRTDKGLLYAKEIEVVIYGDSEVKLYIDGEFTKSLDSLERADAIIDNIGLCQSLLPGKMIDIRSLFNDTSVELIVKLNDILRELLSNNSTVSIEHSRWQTIQDIVEGMKDEI